MIRKIAICIALWGCFFFPEKLYAQYHGIKLSKEQVAIPFEFTNNFIILTVKVNNSFPLKFIFDTGAEHTIITDKLIGDILDLNYIREINLLGADMKSLIKANLATGVELNFENVVAKKQNILVLDHNEVDIDKYLGRDIHGIIGGSIFRYFTIQIDYRAGLLILRKAERFRKPPKKYSVFPIEVIRNKPYINTPVKISGDSILNLRLLLDTGAGLALLLHANTHPSLKLPDYTVPGSLGFGLGGSVEGYLGRVEELYLPPFKFSNLITNFQDVIFPVDSSILVPRNGLIGNLILSRFNVIFDYTRSSVYLRPVKNYNEGFQYDKSGLEIIATGKHLNNFIINNIVPGSPGDLASLQSHDEILSINGTSNKFMTLRGITRRLQKKDGRRIKMVVLRKGQKLKVIFHLKSFI